ncbi:MAG: hypothetical protein H6660_09385 [Ardenticatenaceae bacterium]|nr:hypothetical protein [Ardenticatenaceae bacterium]
MASQLSVPFKGFTGVNTQSDIYAQSNLTDLQRLYWVGQTLRGAPATTHNIFTTFTLPGPIDTRQWQHAFALVAAASDALCSVIIEVNHIPQRRVLSQPPAALELVDLTAVSNPTTAWESWLAQRQQRGLNWQHSLYDSALVQLTPAQFIWYLNLHHLIADATSIFLIYEQVTAVYEQLLQNVVPVLALPTFASYIANKQHYQASSRHSRDQQYWQQKVAAHNHANTHHPKRSQQAATHHRLTIDLGAERSQKLRALARHEAAVSLTPDASLLNIIAALVAVHQYQFNGRSQLSAVAVLHDRPTAACKQTIGPLMEMCPLLVSLPKTDNFLTLLHHVRQDVQQMLIHYRYGSEIARQNQQFDVMLNFARRPALTFQGKAVSHEIIPPFSSSEPLTLHIHELAETNSFLLMFDYHADAFTTAQRQQSLDSFLTLLDNVLAHPERPLTFSPIIASPTPALTPPQPRPITPPRSPEEQQLQRIWQHVLGTDGFGVHDNFFDLGGESWQAMSLCAEIEKVTGHYLPIGTLLQANTIADMAAVLRQQETTWSPVIPIQAGSHEKRPFFCIPGAAGNTLAIDRIARHLSPQQPVYTFLLPGLTDGQTPSPHIPDIAAYYVQAIRQVQANGPYLLGGFSAGSTVALEVAQQLQAAGEAVAALVVMDMPVQSPHFAWVRRGTRLAARLLRLRPTQEERLFLRLRDSWHRGNYWFKRELRGFAARQIKQWRALWQMAGAERQTQWRRLWQNPRLAWAAAETSLPPTDPSLPAYVPPPNTDMDGSALSDPRVFAIFKMNEHAVKMYIPRPFAGRVLLLRCPLGYGRADLRLPDPLLGWGKVARDGVEVHEIPAPGHMAMTREPYVRMVSQHLQQYLDKINQ